MVRRSRWSAAAIAVAAALLSLPDGARAQESVIRPGGDGRCEVPADIAFCSTEGAACGTSSTCRTGASGGFSCVPDGGFVCCSADTECHRGNDGNLTRCVAVSGIASDGGEETGLCLQDRPWCDGGDGDLTLSDVIDNLSATGFVAESWDRGDADGDGLPNARELELVTNHCVAPAPRGYWGGEGCVAIPTGCDDVGAECAEPSGSTCQRTEDENGTECAFDLYSVAWCGGPAFTCVDAQAEDTNDGSGTAQKWCVPLDCAGFPIDLADCVLHEGAPVPWDDGNCDGDGADNGGDEDVCVPDDGVDAGVSDGGGNDVDAGASDAGASGGDAGTDPSLQPTFGGGGGCRCRAAPGRGAAAPIGAMMLLGLVLARRRR